MKYNDCVLYCIEKIKSSKKQIFLEVFWNDINIIDSMAKKLWDDFSCGKTYIQGGDVCSAIVYTEIWSEWWELEDGDVLLLEHSAT